MTAVSKNSIAGNIAPIAIGWSVLLAHLVLIPYTGCGINPARSFGPHAVVLMAGQHIGLPGWWIYYTAPFIGGAAAAMMYKFVFTMEEDAVEDVVVVSKKVSPNHQRRSVPAEQDFSEGGDV